MKAKQLAKGAKLLDDKRKEKEGRNKRRKRRMRSWGNSQINGHKRSKFD